MAERLVYVSQKTHIMPSAPLSHMVERLLDENELDLTKKEVSWKFISSHTARRSFATNLYLRGGDLYMISKLMGHSSVTMTEGYIVYGQRRDIH